MLWRIDPCSTLWSERRFHAGQRRPRARPVRRSRRPLLLQDVGCRVALELAGSCALCQRLPVQFPRESSTPWRLTEGRGRGRTSIRVRMTHLCGTHHRTGPAGRCSGPRPGRSPPVVPQLVRTGDHAPGHACSARDLQDVSTSRGDRLVVRGSEADGVEVVLDHQLEGSSSWRGCRTSGDHFVSRGSQLAGRFTIEETGGSGHGGTHGHGMATTNLLLGTNRIDHHSRYRSVTTKRGER